MDVYYDVGILIAMAAEADDEDAAVARRLFDSLGVDRLGPVFLRFQDTPFGPGYRGATRLPPAESGIGRLARQARLEESDLALIPRDAAFGSVWNLDPESLLGMIRNAVAQIDPEVSQQLDGGLAMADGMLGLSIEHDVLPAFGDTWAFFDAPAHGGLFLTGLCAVAEARDRNAIDAFFRRCVQITTPFAQQADVQLRIEAFEHGGHTVHYLLVGGLPVPITPAWGFAGDYVVFGVHPQVVAVALQHVAPATRGPTILEHPEFRAVRAALPEHLTSFGYVDTSAGAAPWHALKLLAHTALAALAPDSADAFAVADFPVFSPTDVRPYFTGAGIDGDRLVFAEMGYSPAMVMGGGNAVLLAALATSVSILLPSLTRARGLAKRAVSASNLRSIGVGMHMWAQEHDERFASSFDELVQAAYITRDVLESPRQTDMSRAGYVLIPGQSASADPGNVLAYERIVDDEGTNVLFVDGHVEFMRPGEFERALRDTYERLGHPWQPPERE